MSCCEKCGKPDCQGKCEKRINGKRQIKVDRMPECAYQYEVGSMDKAIERVRLTFGMKPWAKEDNWFDSRSLAKAMLAGDHQLTQIMEMADGLVNEAILIDPRLAKKSSWVRAEDGLDACPALIAEGDDRPCFNRKKLQLADQATGEPVRIVISTDSKHIQPENAAAFIAAAKLAQQFRPLEIWWQGGWMNEDNNWCGHVFHVPLIQGDMDFSRLQFVLSHPLRDAVSFRVMASYAYPQSIGWQGGVADRSWLPDTYSFIRESGMGHNGDEVAAYAAHWAGLDSKWTLEVSGSEAEQHWAPPLEGKSYEPTAEERRRWAEEDKRRERERREQARKRATEMN